MRFRLPALVRGWRAFAGEIAVIVIGVLLALGADQFADDIQWNRKVEVGRTSLREDFVYILANAREREGQDACIRQRLAQIAGILNEAEGRLPPIGHIGAPPARPWTPASWDSLVASGVSIHFPTDEMQAYSAIASSARESEALIREELLDWARIYTIVGPGRRLDDGEAGEIRRSIGNALYRLNSVRLFAPQIADSIAKLGMMTKSDWAEVDRRVERRRTGPNWKAICGPIRPASGQLIEAPYDPSVQIDPLRMTASPGKSRFGFRTN